MQRATRRMLALVAAVLLLAAGLAAQKSDSAEALLRAASDKALVDGDLNGAIKQYQTIVGRFKTDRVVVATALVRMAECYQKLGDAESSKIYERVVREFADQTESATTARIRLAALKRPVTEPRLLWGDASLGPAAISPDGRHLVYASPGIMGGLSVRDLRSGLNRRLTVHSAEDPGRPNGTFAFSPDSKVVAYGWQVKPGDSPTMRLISLDGYASRPPYNRDEWIAFAPRDWSSDGKHILGLAKQRGMTSLDIVLVSAAGDSDRILKRGLKAGGPISRITLSRDGRFVAYDNPGQDVAQRDIFVIGVEGGQETRLVARAADDYFPTFTPDGRGLFFLSARPGLDEAWFLRIVDGKPQGSPERVNLDVGNGVGFTAGGSFVYTDAPQAGTLFAAALDSTKGTIAGQPAIVTQRPVTSRSVIGWSPDGQFLAYGSSRPSPLGPLGERVIVVRTVQSGEEREIAPGFRGWSWSPDGRSLLGDGRDQQGRGLFQVDVRTGDAVPVVYAKPGETLDRPSANGTSMVFIRRFSAGAHIVSRDLGTGHERELYQAENPLSIGGHEVSKDGQYLAFVLEDAVARTTSIMVMTAQGEKPRELGGLRWKYPERVIDLAALTPDGRHVLFTTGDVEQPYLGQRLWRIGVDGSGLQEILIQKEYAGTGRTVFHPDGAQFAFAVFSGKQSVWMTDNVLPGTGGVR